MTVPLPRLRPIHFPTPSKQWLQRLFTLLMASIAIYLLLPQITDLEKSWQTVRTLRWQWVALAALAQTVSYVGSGYLLHALVGLAHEHLSVGRGIVLATAGDGVGPLFGGVIGKSASTYYWLRGSHSTSRGAGLAATLPTVFNNLWLLLLSLAGLIHLIAVHELTRAQTVGFIVCIGLVLLVLAIVNRIIRHPDRATMSLQRIEQRLRRKGEKHSAKNIVNSLVNTWHALQHGGWQKPVLASLINISGDVLTIYFLFLAANNRVSLGMLLTGYGLPILLGKVSFLPGGVGIVEATMTAIYTSLSVSNHVAVVVILGYRLISFWLPLLIGAPLAIYLQKTTSEQIESTPI